MEDRNQRPDEISNLPTITLFVLIGVIISLLFISYKYIIDSPTSDIQSLVETTKPAEKPEVAETDVANTKQLEKEAEKEKAALAEEKAAKEAEKETEKKETEKQEITTNTQGIEITHTVKDGETFYGIANRYGLKSAELQALNPDLEPNSMGSGKKINVKVRAKHTIGPGDILKVVATKYGISKEALMAANKLSTDYAKRGDVLLIPFKK
jgi:LysM repeat protein